ncbi:hypothetical protein H8S95_07700 [Pontibacter sp. KCTC 32443]|uniref:hypothetical protein n=1 Tax=Pontibacter TaxID=323449 RepID=UPI00164E2A8F|nr:MULTISPECIES: hypothetical protein [Pontibacter]MBC5773943.1 hypothetical protein [Pontibacter sp. KCTC 32443]
MERSQSLGGAPREVLVPQALRGTSKGSESSAKPKDGAPLKEGPYPRRERTKGNYDNCGQVELPELETAMKG